MATRSDRFPTEALLQLLNHFQPSSIRFSRRVFVNRNLRLKNIQAVGFDMDYTLAIYKPAFDQLAWKSALRRLVDEFDFPEQVLEFKYDPGFALRGLVIDMIAGNIIKLDRHRHVSTAYHGTRELPEETRHTLYRKNRLHLSKPTYFLVDTLFSLPETHMYAQMVDWLDARNEGTSDSYHHAYQCIRKAVDGIHRDGTLKKEVIQDVGRYVDRDDDIAYTLEQFIYSGKKLFLATNSDWHYTQALMSFLLDGRLAAFPHWHDYFEHIIVEARKPEFFAKRRQLKTESYAPEGLRHKAFRGGNLRQFEGLLQCAGESVLYIGDHIYGDILRSKKSSAWRTAMIIPEMERELAAMASVREETRKWEALFERRVQLEVEANYQQRLLGSLLNLEELSAPTGDEEGTAPGDHPIARVSAVCERNITEIRHELDLVEEQIEANMKLVLKPFNPYWGRLFKDGTGHSVFGEQVGVWAGLYTSRLANFLSYSPIHYFRAGPDLLPHERTR
jgi:5'-nucleotidase